ncbi:MAG: TIGR04283 family arsenosugar biosynthesis glycosyltransferase [Roseovarius sp.]|uniref:TIGR04283 family arsenosugar biosynthesis glycosyltransferase n=1 Tax=Roseovarius sp. TaxID=1486281 RepID=UPI001B4ADA67|nr:TIGR04283 family arsenosugar biosynthesis glycosyltransferase [Roseovarius sp.]MBQ0751150.1 TIGR04283 family arsenosugar biosynthesis glycosyltransferase [Roseovarius sp.]MBQ0811401.1 TIGR04283 family arsenosugar biosynthesis glycosyltransferase [Roseovarius sp.]
MRAALSVVIPTRNAGAGLPSCLAALMEGLEAGLIRELIVSDAGSEDATLQIADAAGAVIVQGAASRGGQLRRGAQVAGGDWLLFLHADTVLPPGWAGVVSARMAQGGPAAFRLAFDAAGVMPRLVAGWANLRSRVLGLPYGDQALLIARNDYEAVGGFADIPLMEDVAIARALKGRIALLPLAVTTSAARYQREGWLWRGARNLWTLIRYLCGVDPEVLAKAYRRGGRGS